MMTLTLQWMKENFDKYNNLYWDGKLKTPTFQIVSTRCTNGAYRYSKEGGFLKLSNYHKNTEKEFANTLIHEMIHAYIRQNHLAALGDHHGEVFQKEAARLNALGWNISRCTDFSKVEPTIKTTYRVMDFKDGEGRYFRFVMNNKKVQMYRRRAKRAPYHFTDWFIHTSDDWATYDRYPRCVSSCRGAFITQEEFEQDRLKSKTKLQAIPVQLGEHDKLRIPM